MRQIIKSIAAKVPHRVYDRCRAWSVMDQNFRSQLSRARKMDSRETLWQDLLSSIGTKEKILLLEFGVFNGYSIHHFAEINRNPASKFIGFDSFEGLPEDWTPKCPKGTFSQSGQLPEVRDSRITFVKGWFSDTRSPSFMISTAITGSRFVISTRICILPLFSVSPHFCRDFVIFTSFSTNLPDMKPGPCVM